MARYRAGPDLTADQLLRQRIERALTAAPRLDLAQAAEGLLDVLGYRSERRPLEQSGRVDDFIGSFPAPNPDTHSEGEFRENVTAVQVLFQFTSDEIPAGSGQGTLFETDGFERGNTQSFMFAAVELSGPSYARGPYARFTREINKRLRAPTVVIFRTAGGRLTLAFVHRRPHKLDPKRDVLGSVSLIREIAPGNPHRAHLDILADLSIAQRIQWMDARNRSHNFDGLLAAYLAALDTQELNDRFYVALRTWFKRAVDAKETRFPRNQQGKRNPEEHIIRLITRLLFVWFVKEKGLVADDLFIEERVGPLLRDYDRANGDSYYRAVLQNLFFATLNTEIRRRGFSKRTNATHRDFSRYRYQDEMQDPGTLLGLFNQTPFINGGLFDCLDSEESTRDGGSRIDCFSDNPKHRALLSIPNWMFFGDHGLVDLLDSYKFTVEENTPAEQDVALDPELLGSAFENLLAEYNPETREAVRKRADRAEAARERTAHQSTRRRQTGSYYTPRPVVDYMVDEALIESLAEKTTAADGDAGFWRDRLRYLLDYHDAAELFEDEETDRLVRAIAQLKVLDPAVGSGAFPMGVLQKLTLALRRLDPDNRRWEVLQKGLALARAEHAFEAPNQLERDAELQEISDTFERYRDSDFGRKLYLIQNSIFGVDIQPVACQLSKLRFFISLAIEQEPTDDRDANYGIKPLPNLETRFIAADTLLDLHGQLVLRSADARDLERGLHNNRERYFHATTRRTKRKYRIEDQRLRDELAAELTSLEIPADTAARVAHWAPYDQNERADWFDAEYMFGVTGGFDVVVGNPPYIQLQKNRGRLAKRYQNAGYETYARTGDIYQLFYEKGCQLLAKGRGILSYISSNSWLRAEYGIKQRGFLASKHTPLQLLELGKDVFDNTIVDTNIMLLRQGGSARTCPAVDVERIREEGKGKRNSEFPPDRELWVEAHLDIAFPWSILSKHELSVMGKMQAVGTPLKEWDVSIYRGVTTGLNSAFIIDDATQRALVASDSNSAEIIKPVLRGRDIQRYRAPFHNFYVIATLPSLNLDIDRFLSIKNHLHRFGKERLEQSGSVLPDGSRSRKRTSNSWFELQDACNYYRDFDKEKLVWIELVTDGRFAYDDSGKYCEATAFMMSGESMKFLCALLNSKIVCWFLSHVAPTSGMGTLRWKKAYVETIPVPRVSVAEQELFTTIVDCILSAKDADLHADTSALESKIDAMVYGLYGLSDAEITVIEASQQ